MSITMQGSWTVSVKSKNAAFEQRFIISGATSGNGTYAGVTTTTPVFVTGDHWTVKVQHRTAATAPWLSSAERITFPGVTGGQIRFDIQSNDSGSDTDFNDLVLTCSMPANSSEYVIYGSVHSYSGLCVFNPCYPFPSVVIDSPLLLKEALKYGTIRKVLEEYYPERIKEYAEQHGIIRPPRPEPDPLPFIPLLIPLGGSISSETSRRVTTQLASDAQQSIEMAPARTIALEAQTTRLDIGAAKVSTVASYASEIAKYKDLFRPACVVTPQPGLLLRFLEYDRTTAELAGGSYTGTGARELLGHTVTDERGNYIFHFSWSLAQIASEATDVTTSGAPLATQLRPDLIAQVVSGTAAGVLYESALYPDVANVKRIDLCIPETVLNPGPSACQGGRAIQAIGNIWTLAGVGNTLDTAGRITATNPLGPIITRGAWVGTLDVFACFLDQPNVEYYTIRFRKPGGGWGFVQELYRHIKIADIGLPGYIGTKVGPDTRSLAVDGGAKVNVPSYQNIESDPEWIATHRLRKIRLSSTIYENALYGPGDSPRSVDFKLEGYNAAGDKVAGAEDTIRLYLDNRPVAGNIAEVTMGATAQGECALFELPAANTTLTVRFKVDQPGGFVQQYLLDVIRGSNTSVPVSDTTAPVQPLELLYNEATHGNFFFGTLNGVSPDGDRYVVAELQPSSTWLPADKNFCSFAFRVHATPRTTNGYGLTPGGYVDFELIGISYTAVGT